MSAHIKSVSPDAWQHVVYDTLRKHDVTQFAYVPDAGHRIGGDVVVPAGDHRRGQAVGGDPPRPDDRVQRAADFPVGASFSGQIGIGWHMRVFSVRRSMQDPLSVPAQTSL